MVLDVDPQKRRISLGLKQCADNPWVSFAGTHPTGTQIDGEIKSITEFGLFIGLEGNVDGMVHLSDLDWSRPGDEAIAEYSKGDMVKAVVLDVNTDRERISLGIKQLSDDPFANAADLKRGYVVTCTVTDILGNGLNVKFGDGMTGFIRKGDLSRERSEQRPDRYAVGDKVDAKVNSVDRDSRRVSLSIKSLEIAEEKEAMAQYGSSDSGASLGDILGAAMSKARTDSEDPAEEKAPTEADEAPETASSEAAGEASEAEAETESKEEIVEKDASETDSEAKLESADVANEAASDDAEDKKPD
jgi:small subunit ribosomal protein S1